MGGASFLKSEDNSSTQVKITQSAGGHAVRLGAAKVREELLTKDLSNLELKTSPISKTGYVGIIKIKGKFQARVQVPGDGRGGTRKRKQYPLPGLFGTARDAAQFRALVITAMKANNDGCVVAPPKQNKPRTRRASRCS